jgi:hypothetical protein
LHATPSAIVKITHNLLWFNIECNINTLENRKKNNCNRKKTLTYSYRKLRTASPHISSPFAKKKHGGEWDHDGRNNIGKIKDSLEKVQKIISIHPASVQEGINPTMMNCLEKHFQNDILLLINKHSRNGQMPHSKFRKSCSGKGNSCTTH